MDQSRLAGLAFVPEVFRSRRNTTFEYYQDRLWDLTEWMRGSPVANEDRSAVCIARASAALAKLHRSWRPGTPDIGTCPAIARRLARACEWLALVRSGWRPDFAMLPSLRNWSELAWRALQKHAPLLPDRLAPWMQHTVPRQPCLCDVRREHVLFTSDEVTGIVDYGGVKTDNVAVDLARMLGSMVPDRPAMWLAGIEAYRQLQSLSELEIRLIRVLDESGRLLGAANWLRWLYLERRDFDMGTVEKRLADLVPTLPE
jgi:Ser/Thr protein kinase RdoA (MazF antagonist)